jgi:Transglycosylase SLT domain/D-alanyl-D-alanine carboxypeptidase
MSGARVILVTSVGDAAGAGVAAAALASAGSGPDDAALLIELTDGRPPKPSLIATAAARKLAERLAAHLPQAGLASRGRFCHLALPADAGGVGQIAAALPLVRGALAVLHLPPTLLQPTLAEPGIRPSAALLRADPARDRALLALVAGELIDRGLRVAVLKRQPGWISTRAVLLGASFVDRTLLPVRVRERVLGEERDDREARSHRTAEAGQALVLAMGGAFAILALALALVAIAGAVTGKGRAQRAADLAAISAARSMRDDLPRLLSPAALPDGVPNPGHLSKAAYLRRAHTAAAEAAKANGIAADGLRISFPDRAAFAPVRTKAVITGGLALSSDEVEASAVAEAAAPSAAVGAAPTMANGGGYGGPLVYRNGEGMRPDVATAFDRMAAAAARDGLSLVVNSGFRSDAEQAALFAAHPDPTWVAPPGRSLHRCATELDLGPESAYGWLAANAARFGFVQRYSWEAWHYGYDRPPAPCSAAANAPGATGGGNPMEAGGGGDGALSGTGLPSFVPARYRAPLLRAAAHWNVSAALLAAQLMAESNFNPFATSPAGAQGIAQFLPSTAAGYGLRDPFDPVEAIDAQAHLMSDLLRQFGDPALALAAYNAGPAAVEGCSCVPAYPETQAYVSRILALLNGAGALVLPDFEVRLIA